MSSMPLHGSFPTYCNNQSHQKKHTSHVTCTHPATNDCGGDEEDVERFCWLVCISTTV